ncbi:MAG: virulence factor MviN [Phycicoccus sp.]|nr:virulence factor MviN [Phycicoccus sp.]
MTEATQRRLATGIAGAAGLIAVLTLLARIAGFGRVLVFADAVRAAGVGEIYQSVNTVPNVLFEVAAGGVLAAVIVPLVAHRIGAGERAEADRIAGALLSWALLLLIPLGLLLAVFARPVSTWLVADFDPAARDVATTLVRIFALQVPLYGLGIILTGVLHAHRRFLAAALAPLLSSLVVLVSYLWYGSLTGGLTAPSQVSSQAIAVLGWGTTAGVVALSVPLLIPAWRAGWRWHPTLTLPPGVGARVRVLAGAGLIGLVAQQGAVLATMWLANHAGARGVFPVYQYAQAVYLLPYAVLAVPIATSTFPALAERTGAGDDASPTLGRAIQGVLWLTGLSAAVVVVVAPAVGAFFAALDARRGAEGASPVSLAALGPALVAFAPGLIGYGLSALLIRALYVKGEATRAGLAVAAGWVIAGAGPLLLVGANAGAAATLRALGGFSSLGMTVTAVLLGLLVRRSWGPVALSGTLATLGRLIVAIAVAVVTADLVRFWLPIESLGTALVNGVVSGVVALLAGLAVAAVLDRSRVAELRRRGQARRQERRR